jgi:ketosteroid isomerase-like protein
MYRAIVTRVVRRVYQRLSEGDVEPVLASFSPTAVLWFGGDHAMGGHLQGADLIRQWFQRTFRLFPDLRLVPQTIVASGPPWNTTVATRFTVTASLPDGGQYHNEGMQLLRLGWGRVVEDRLYEDTQALVSALEGSGDGATPKRPRRRWAR